MMGGSNTFRNWNRLAKRDKSKAQRRKAKATVSGTEAKESGKKAQHITTHPATLYYNCDYGCEHCKFNSPTGCSKPYKPKSRGHDKKLKWGSRN